MFKPADLFDLSPRPDMPPFSTAASNAWEALKKIEGYLGRQFESLTAQ